MSMDIDPRTPRHVSLINTEQLLGGEKTMGTPIFQYWPDICCMCLLLLPKWAHSSDIPYLAVIGE
jgi:hypothetical protein